MTVGDVEETLRSFLAEHAPSDAVAAYLFGSFARGTAGPDSDVDVALLYAEPPAPTLEAQPFDLEADLEKLLDRPVQVVVLNTAPIDLIHRILCDGRLVFERDRSRRIHFEVRARNEYFDFEPVLRQYWRLPARRES
jgi:uncharacterized protein